MDRVEMELSTDLKNAKGQSIAGLIVSVQTGILQMVPVASHVETRFKMEMKTVMGQ